MIDLHNVQCTIQCTMLCLDPPECAKSTLMSKLSKLFYCFKLLFYVTHTHFFLENQMPKVKARLFPFRILTQQTIIPFIPFTVIIL